MNLFTIIIKELFILIIILSIFWWSYFNHFENTIIGLIIIIGYNLRLNITIWTTSSFITNDFIYKIFKKALINKWIDDNIDETSEKNIKEIWISSIVMNINFIIITIICLYNITK